MTVHAYLLLSCGLLALALASSGCETSLDPFEETDVRFSVFGYLDVSADTQFVRVSELRESIFLTDELDAVVVLEEVSGATRTELRDSLLTFTSGTRVHAPWTAVPIAPSSTYRLSVTASDGSSASATIQTPAPSPEPFLNAGVTEASNAMNPPNLQAISIPGVEKLADLRIEYVLAETGSRVTVSYLDQVRRDPNGVLQLGFDAYADVQQQVTGGTAGFCPSLESAAVFIATTTDAWPDFALIDLERLVLPGTVSNVEGGLGFVGGVATQRRPWLALTLAFSINQASCQL
ncbi:MAG: hypothetical protein AAF089_14610 [Bacteroidota bacterium]